MQSANTVMLRRIKKFTVFFAFVLSILLILAGIRYTDDINNHPYLESHRNINYFLRLEDVKYNFWKSVTTSRYDESLNIDKLLEMMRSKIKYELRNYNFTYSGIHQLEDLLLEGGGHPLRSLIVSTWRSGTTFLGEVLNAMPSNFYHYEPLQNKENLQIRGPPLADKALSTIKNMFYCNYEDMEGYFEYKKMHMHQFSYNTRLWDHCCKYNMQLCFDSDFMAKFCKLFPFQSMKVVHIRLRLIEEILQDKLLNVKVVLLIRDPRAVMQSRLHRGFCHRSADCWQPELLCADMISDYVAAGRLLQNYPERLMVLRYEELALNPNSTTHDLFKFLRLTVMPPVEDFLHTHTNYEFGGVSATFRVSRDVPFKWKNMLDFNYVESIQIACKEAMGLWGYRMAHNASHMASKEFYPLEEYTLKQ